METQPYPPVTSMPLALSKDERTWALAVHLSAFAGHIFPLAHVIVPLVIWQMKKDSSAFLDDQGKEAVNAQISFTIYFIVSLILCFVVIGVPMVAGLYVANFIFVILAAIAANEGKYYRYPLILRLIK